jgi:chaperonin cofactor prefoldin
MSDEAQTRPTLETILERINALGTELREFRIAVEDRLEQIETRLDRTQGIALETRADLRELRADLRARFKQPA